MTRITIERLEELIADVDGELVPGCSEWSQIYLKLRADKLAALRELRAYRKAGWVLVPRGLLKAAKCPNVGCDEKGWVARQFAAGEWEQEQCQWCCERNDALTAAPEPQEEPKP